jgi:quercetin dioxygenase-like cupin family protein
LLLRVACRRARRRARQAPTPPIKRTILQKTDVPGSTTHEVIFALAELTGTGNAGRHTHPGPEMGTVIDGELVLMVEGQPDKTIKVGESFQVAGGVIHDAKTGGGKPAKVLVVYTIKKGEPLAIPAK